MIERMKASELRELQDIQRNGWFGKRPAGKNKYGAKTAYRCEDCGGWATKVACLVCQSQRLIKFDSKAEAFEYDKLRQRQDRGEIFDLELQPGYPIYIKGRLVCKVILDFRYTSYNPKQHHTVDVKGHDNALSRLKRKMVEAAYGFKVEVIR